VDWFLPLPRDGPPLLTALLALSLLASAPSEGNTLVAHRAALFPVPVNDLPSDLPARPCGLLDLDQDADPDAATKIHQRRAAILISPWPGSQGGSTSALRGQIPGAPSRARALTCLFCVLTI
jgi:hypothetical protein